MQRVYLVDSTVDKVSWALPREQKEIQTSTQCSSSRGGFALPTVHVNVRRARNGLSVVLVTANGGSVAVIGLTSVEGGSDKQVMVNFSRKVVMCRLCWRGHSIDFVEWNITGCAHMMERTPRGASDAYVQVHPCDDDLEWS